MDDPEVILYIQKTPKDAIWASFCYEVHGIRLPECDWPGKKERVSHLTNIWNATLCGRQRQTSGNRRTQNYRGYGRKLRSQPVAERRGHHENSFQSRHVYSSQRTRDLDYLWATMVLVGCRSRENRINPILSF